MSKVEHRLTLLVHLQWILSGRQAGRQAERQRDTESERQRERAQYAGCVGLQLVVVC